MIALHARVQHAAVGHSVGGNGTFFHLVPDAQHLREVAGLAVRLDQSTIGDGARLSRPLVLPVDVR